MKSTPLLEEWREKLNKINNRYLDFDEDTNTLYFKSYVPNMKTRKFEDNSELWEKEVLLLLLQSYEQGKKEERERIRKLVAMDRPMFLRNNIVKLLELDMVIKIRTQLRKEILADIDAFTNERKEKV